MRPALLRLMKSARGWTGLAYCSPSALAVGDLEFLALDLDDDAEELICMGFCVPDDGAGLLVLAVFALGAGA